MPYNAKENLDGVRARMMQEVPPTTADDIAKDVGRTFPNMPRYANPETRASANMASEKLPALLDIGLLFFPRKEPGSKACWSGNGRRFLKK